MEPIKPLQQTTPTVENQNSNFKSQSRGSQVSVYNIVNNIVTEVFSSETDFVDDGSGTDGDVNPPIVDPNNPGGDNLPDGFTFTVVASNPAITTSSDGSQTANMDVQIPDVDGIIDWEVRLILNG